MIGTPALLWQPDVAMNDARGVSGIECISDFGGQRQQGLGF